MAQHNASEAALAYLQEAGTPVPDEYTNAVGDGDFKAIGAEFLVTLVDFGGLGRQDRILDFGCGYGRIALALNYYLGPDARYSGVDVSRPSIQWCNDIIAAKDPRYVFKHLDVAHEIYNPTGFALPASTPLPYDTASFDFIFATSVFTHMDKEMFAHFFGKLGRLLAPGGRLLLTAFLVNERNRDVFCTGPRFVFDSTSVGPVFPSPPPHPLAATAVQEVWPKRIAAEGLGLKYVNQSEGHWWQPAPKANTPFQDLILFQKPDEASILPMAVGNQC
jgi:SAM-dependent methyltransferase